LRARAPGGLERFFERLSVAPTRVLMLDYDGTLAPFALRPQDARPYPGVAELLDEIMQQPGSRVVVVTGRALTDPPALGVRRAPEIWGAHGWEWWAPGSGPVVMEPAAPTRDRLLAAAARVQPLARWGARIEPKPASVAVHWRGLDAGVAGQVREALARAWGGRARAHDLELLEFDGGAELRARGRNKGSVVRRVLAESGREALAAYLGDDRTDEDAFAAIRGRGCGVLVRPAWRPTQARVWLRPPEDLKAFLERWLDCGRRLH
jgi:trehalose-phosphatase